MRGSGGDAESSDPPPRPRAATWHCPNPSEFSLLVVTQHLDVVVQLCGELDLEALDSLEACLGAAMTEEPRRLVLDLSALAFIDAAGVAVLLRSRRLADAAGIGFVLDSPTPQVVRVLEIMDLARDFEIR